MKWMKNSKGNEDFLLTTAFISFVVVSACIILSLFKGFIFKNLSVEIATPDNSLLTFYLTSTFGAYVARRSMADKNDTENKK